MPNCFILLLISSLLLICYRPPPTNATECIDMDVHANDVVNCCRQEMFFTKEAGEKCFGELSPQMSPDTSDFTVCYVDCLHRAMGYLTADNKMDVPKYISYLDRFDVAYKMAATSAINHCATLEQDIRRDVETLQSKCSAFSLLFHVCVAQLTMQSCPTERWRKGDLCDKVKMGIPPCN